ncbi:MAG: hypothetical protein RBG13Loki_3715 [Promethearchaeota archaeon CR_4]|nr:MAG: hypothetical protein RBG13Loki_3715 [Candidatus Lokiarchaeota archaeon CR_4]
MVMLVFGFLPLDDFFLNSFITAGKIYSSRGILVFITSLVEWNMNSYCFEWDFPIWKELNSLAKIENLTILKIDI